VKIKDSKVADAFINAIEESKRVESMIPASAFNARMATREDSVRLREIRLNNRKVVN
jgi:hypothetical protein